MTDDFNEFFDDNTHWVEQGSEPMRGAEPPEPPKSRREMRKRRAQRRRKRISGIIIAIAIVALLIGGGYFGVTKLIAWRDSRSNQSTAIADYPGPGYGEVEFTVSEGQGAAEIADNLLKAEVIKVYCRVHPAVGQRPNTTRHSIPGNVHIEEAYGRIQSDRRSLRHQPGGGLPRGSSR